MKAFKATDEWYKQAAKYESIYKDIAIEFIKDFEKQTEEAFIERAEINRNLDSV